MSNKQHKRSVSESVKHKAHTRANKIKKLEAMQPTEKVLARLKFWREQK